MVEKNNRSDGDVHLENPPKKREFIFIEYIKKVVQVDYPDNGLRAELTVPGQDISRRAGTNCNILFERDHLRSGMRKGGSAKGGSSRVSQSF